MLRQILLFTFLLFVLSEVIPAVEVKLKAPCRDNQTECGDYNTPNRYCCPHSNAVCCMANVQGAQKRFCCPDNTHLNEKYECEPDNENCRVCHFIADKVILHGTQGVCEQAPDPIRNVCRLITAAFGVTIETWLRNGLDKYKICTNLKFCPHACLGVPRGCKCGDNDCREVCPLDSIRPCRTGCTPQGRVPIEKCDWYKTPEVLTYLPTAYASSASCACRLETFPGKNSDSAMCVRSTLIKLHDELNPELKKKMIDMKKKHCNDLICSPEYAQWIQDNFVQVAYDLHIQAFRSCCCNSPPAEKFFWRLVMFNWRGVVPCSLISDMIKWRGSCGCQGW